MDNASLFKGIDTSNAARDSEYFRPGKYLTQINKFIAKTNDSGVTYFIFEMKVIAVIDPSEALKDPNGPHTVGSKVSWLLARHKKPTWPNLKAALMAITGVPEDSITPEFCGDLIAAAQPLSGMFVEWRNKLITTKEKGLLFTKVTAVRAWSDEEVKAYVDPNVLESLGIKFDE